MKLHSAYSFTFLTSVMHKAPSLVAAMILTRAFSPETMGYYFVFSAVCYLTLIVSTFGTHQFLVRGVAKAPDDSIGLIGEVLTLRLFVTAAALLALNLGTAVAAPSFVNLMAPISVFILVGDYSNSFGAYITGQRAFALRFLVSLPGPVVLISSVPLMISSGAGLPAVLLCFVASGFVAIVVGWATVHFKYGSVSFRHVRTSSIRRLVALCAPFVGLEILQVVQFKADVLMVFWILSSEAAAQYETAYRLLEVSRLLARPLAASALPICAYLIAQGDWGAARLRAVQSVRYAAILGLVPLAIGLTAPDWIMTFVWGEAYRDGGEILRVLLLGAPMVFVVLIGVMLAIVLEREMALIKVMGAATVFNISLNAMVIPIWGGTGAAVTTLATELVIVTGLLFILRDSAFNIAQRDSRV